MDYTSIRRPFVPAYVKNSSNNVPFCRAELLNFWRANVRTDSDAASRFHVARVGVDAILERFLKVPTRGRTGFDVGKDRRFARLGMVVYPVKFQPNSNRHFLRSSYARRSLIN